MEKKWFTLINDRVSGPYSTNEVTAQLQQEQYENIFIWWRGQTGWMSLLEWKKKLPELQSDQLSTPEKLWRLKISGNELQPMSRTDTIDVLLHAIDLNLVALWSDKHQEWQSIYSFQDLVEELGICRRRHPRVPIMGVVTLNQGNTIRKGKINTISEGGMGIIDVKDVHIGDVFKIVLESPHLNLPVRATAEVVYISNENYLGLHFTNIPLESVSAIIEYVRKYTGIKQSKAA